MPPRTVVTTGAKAAVGGSKRTAVSTTANAAETLAIVVDVVLLLDLSAEILQGV